MSALVANRAAAAKRGCLVFLNRISRKYTLPPPRLTLTEIGRDGRSLAARSTLRRSTALKSEGFAVGVMGSAQPATTEAFDLAEGPFWDAQRDLLSWVDVTNGDVYHGLLLADGAIEIGNRWHFDLPVAAAVPGSCGDTVICLGGQILRHNRDGSMTTMAAIIDTATDPFRRLNDAKPDPLGLLVAGTLRAGGSEKSELLVRLERDGSITRIDDDLGLSNGLAWSTDGSVMFSVDTISGVIYRRSYPELGPRDVHIEFTDGYPDGICLDAEDHLWVAVWGAGEVRRFDPDGALAGVVRVPAPHTSSVAFAGPDLGTLVITTARSELTAQQLAVWPDSGRLFTFEPGVRGLPATPWRGVSIIDESERRL